MSINNPKASLIFWGIITIGFVLIISIFGLTGVQSNTLLSAARICIWPALIMFAVSLGFVLKESRRKE